MNNYLLRLTQAQNLLGLYRAEWLSSKLFDHFNEPGYFSELKTNRPCVLIGGRGTGKTTVLKGLSYDGQFTLNQLFTKREKLKIGSLSVFIIVQILIE